MQWTNFSKKLKKKAILSSTCKKIRIAYGGASFDSTGKHEKFSAPTSFQFKRLKVMFGENNVNVVDEFRTTKCCFFCGVRGDSSVLQNVYEPKPSGVSVENWFPVRGLKRCNHIYCSNFLDRDYNAALNILAVHTAVAGCLDRPIHLLRDNVIASVEPGRFVLNHAVRTKGRIPCVTVTADFFKASCP